MRRPPPRSTLFPYTTLFRSLVRASGDAIRVAYGRRVNGGRRRPAIGMHRGVDDAPRNGRPRGTDRKSTRLNSSHMSISYAVFCLKKKKKKTKKQLMRTNSRT